MRVWDIPVSKLCNKHLIAQHHEIHCIYNIIAKGLKGFAYHPEVMRWRGRLASLWWEHKRVVLIMESRELKHKSVLCEPPNPIIYYKNRPEPWQPVEKQIQILHKKGCNCNI